MSICGASALIRDEDGFSCLDYNTSTSGYVEAFRATCKKLDMEWLFNYWNELPWYRSDIFDSEIADEVMKRFDSNDSANAYYKYLIERGKEDVCSN